jgi:hypothetical protein
MFTMNLLLAASICQSQDDKDHIKSIFGGDDDRSNNN